MSSNITPMRAKYGTLTEILPEELDSDLEINLKTYRDELESAITKDFSLLEGLIEQKRLTISFEEMEKPVVHIRKAFLLKNEKLRRYSEKISFLLANLFIARAILLDLSSTIIETIPTTRQHYQDYLKYKPTQREKRMAFIFLTRSYQETIGHAVNICDIIEEYMTLFENLRKLLDPEYKIQHQINYAHVYDYELLAGAYELLLRGNTGRFTPPPLIRTALEVIITRNILSTEHSLKFAGKSIEILRSFEFRDLLDTIQNLEYSLAFGTDTTRRLYEWGSISTHKGYRMFRSHIWYAYVITRSLTNGLLVKPKQKKIEEAIDEIIEDLEKKGKIKLYYRTNGQ